MSWRRILLGVALALLTAASPAAESPVPPRSDNPLVRYATDVEEFVDRALSMIGVRYRRGGDTPETGFDCSGLVRRVARETLGLDLPHRALDMSRLGMPVVRTDLQPGDLVFFNTMRRAFSHVGIYLGDFRFVHAPAPGGRVRVDDLRDG
ncbi:MAG: C40 family peptidase [Betaproteobacteria bacterium]|nr:C40 family peptidase [Betaproteobacteria bacterium]